MSNEDRHFKDEDHGTPCGRKHAKHCADCNEILDNLAALYAASRLHPRATFCRWGCERPGVARLEDQGGPAECGACTRHALRHGREKSGRPVRRVRGVA